MKIGPYKLSTYNFGFFRLDGGSMFGSVPKNIWSKKIPADNENCIRLATRSLILEDGKRTILVDVGMGNKWSEKESAIYQVEANQTPLPIEPEKITDVVLTHLHFDHAGGISYFDGANLKLSFPKAAIHLQKSNLENAQNPTIKERASYLKENFEPLKSHANLNLLDGDCEIYPGLWVHRVDGHTLGQQWIEVRSQSAALFYTTDLIPTSHHLPLPYHMGYDTCATTLLREKNDFLNRALNPDVTVMFEHDPQVVACKVALNERGQYYNKETVSID